MPRPPWAGAADLRQLFRYRQRPALARRTRCDLCAEQSRNHPGPDRATWQHHACNQLGCLLSAWPVQGIDRRQGRRDAVRLCRPSRSEEHTSELQSLMRISSAVFCLKNKKFTLCLITLSLFVPHSTSTYTSLIYPIYNLIIYLLL